MMSDAYPPVSLPSLVVGHHQREVNSRRPKRVVTASDDPEVRDFLKALAALSACAARIAGLNRRTILKGLAELDHDPEQQLERMLNLMDDIQQSFIRIRRKLES